MCDIETRPEVSAGRACTTSYLYYYVFMLIKNTFSSTGGLRMIGVAWQEMCCHRPEDLFQDRYANKCIAIITNAIVIIVFYDNDRTKVRRCGVVGIAHSLSDP